MPFFLWFTESEFFDYILSLYPAGWKEKAIILSDLIDKCAIVFVLLTFSCWLGCFIFTFYKKLKKNENKMTSVDGVPPTPES